MLKLSSYFVISCAATAFILHFRNKDFWYASVIVCLGLLPFAAFLAGLVRFRPSRALRDQCPAHRVGDSSGGQIRPRVTWLVFDELDQRLAFDNRPADFRMPVFDQLFERSMICSDAYPPSRCTEISIPALLTGRLVRETVPYGNGNLALEYVGEKDAKPFQSQPTIFDKIAERHLNAAAVVGYHPLSRVLGSKLVDCFFTAAPTQMNTLDVGFFHSVGRCLRSIFETPSYSLFGASLVGLAAADRYIAVIERAEKIAADPTVDFAFIHLPIPHAPYIFDSTSEAIKAGKTHLRRYFENLALADKALGLLLSAIERGRPESVVIVTSDHWWRKAAAYDGVVDRRVPLALHFFGQTANRRYTDKLNTVSLQDLTLAIIDRKVSTPDEVDFWLRANGSQEQPTKL